jgi:hypothetical protein
MSAPMSARAAGRGRRAKSPASDAPVSARDQRAVGARALSHANWETRPRDHGAEGDGSRGPDRLRKMGLLGRSTQRASVSKDGGKRNSAPAAHGNLYKIDHPPEMRGNNRAVPRGNNPAQGFVMCGSSCRITFRSELCTSRWPL